MSLPQADYIPQAVYDRLREKGFNNPRDLERVTGYPASTVYSMYRDWGNTSLRKVYQLAVLCEAETIKGVRDPVGYTVDICCDTNSSTRQKRLRALINHGKLRTWTDVDTALEWPNTTFSKIVAGRWSATTFEGYQRFCKLAGMTLTELCETLFEEQAA